MKLTEVLMDLAAVADKIEKFKLGLIERISTWPNISAVTSIDITEQFTGKPPAYPANAPRQHYSTFKFNFENGIVVIKTYNNSVIKLDYTWNNLAQSVVYSYLEIVDVMKLNDVELNELKE